MTYVNGYVVNDKGQIYEISKLSRMAVGRFIGTHYGKIRTIQRELFLLHKRLHEIRLADGEEAILTPTNVKILKELKIQDSDVDAFLDFEEQKRVWNTPRLTKTTEEMGRLRQVFRLAIQVLEKEADYEVVKSVLMQGIQEEGE
jgi:hypothetical protein|tara:strand:- start:275 stop:706 length:432 start_codon:yes stop_codon:yes gene_type:complete